MFYSITIVVAAFFLDLLLGDPRWMPHPVRAIGWLIAKLEPFLRKRFPKDANGERLAGIFLWVIVTAFAAGGGWLILYLAGILGKQVLFIVEIFMTYQLFAARSLYAESMRVCKDLRHGDLQAARKSLSMIVGRDTEKLTPIQVAKAAVETVAENTSDGVIAPMIFVLIGGVPLGLFYKAVNTLDSMVGYKNETYRHFGWFSARADDVLNFLPARISALLMIVCSAVLGLDAPEAVRIWRRDRKNHASPNSAQTEAVCAGALGIQLAGDAYYGGVLVEKPTIGDDTRIISQEDILRANRLMLLAAVLGLAVFCCVKLALVFLMF